MFFEDIIFNVVPFFIGAVFIFVFGMIIWTIITSIKTQTKNNASPILTVPAQVVAKRTEVRGEHSFTWYYSTFQVESGDRMEFEITGNEYGLLAEDDFGLLTFQGTRFQNFERRS